jgi:uncharacterized membrane protein YqgA involved in biofilm formation
MTGTWINIATVLVGGSLGLFFGSRISERIRQTVVAALGLFTLAVGIELYLRGVEVEGERVVIPLVSLLAGGILGEWWRIEDRLSSLGAWLEARFMGESGEGQSENRFVRGFLTASLLFCVGPMTILGSIQDGLSGDYELLAIKSVLDGFASLALASTFGIGVLFSIFIVLAYQGGLSLAAAGAQAFFDPVMLAELTVVGGILLLGLAVSSLLDMKKIRVGNLLPALLLAPLLAWLLTALGF